MGCDPFYCCFENFRPNIIALIGIISNCVGIAFILWALFDLDWKRNLAKFLYILSFIMLILALFLLIIIYFLLNSRKEPNNVKINKIGKILCILIILFCFIYFLLLLIAEIIEIIDYTNIEKIQPGRDIPIHKWAAAIIQEFRINFFNYCFTMC